MITTALHEALIILGLLLIISLFASKIASRSGVPALLLFVGIGMLIGSEGIGGLVFDNPRLTQDIGIVALIFILFSGGLDTDWQDIRPVWREGLALSTVGVLLTALSVGLFAHVVLGFSLEAGILLGAIMSSTDAAAVFGVLRGQSINLKGNLGPTLELESGSNDPMAVFLTLAMIDLIVNPAATPLALLPRLIYQMGLGFMLGYVLGQLALWMINVINLEYDGLYPALTVSFVLLLYGLTTALDGNGFLAVYVGAVMLARQNFIHKNSLINFHDGMAWLMQIAMFLTLGLQIFPSELVDVAPQGIVLAAVLIFVARPVGVYASLWFAPVSHREKIFLSWVGLRGAAPIILATFPLLYGVQTPTPIFSLVFFVVLASILLQGTTIVPVARWLRLYDNEPRPQSLLAQIMQGKWLRNNIIELVVPRHAEIVGKRVIDLDLSDVTLLVLISRRDNVIVPNGNTVIEAGDHVLLLVDDDDRENVRDRLLAPASGG